MKTSGEPLVVVQPNHRGRYVVVGLAVEKEPIGEEVAKFSTNQNSTREVKYLSTVVGDSNESREESGTETTSRAPTVWRDLVTHLSTSRRSAIEASWSFFPHIFTIESLVPLLSQDESPRTQEQAAKKLAEISTVDEHRSAIARSSQAMAGLTRLLFVDNLSSQYHAAVALGNLAAIENNLQGFMQFPHAVTGLVRLLFRYDDGLVQQGAAMAMANLSLWSDGKRMIFDTAQSVKGLVGLAVVTQQTGQYRGQEDAQRALLNLALSPENRPILDCPMSLPALARFLSPHDQDDQRTNCLSILEDALRALASLSYTEENARRIAESGEFPRFLAVLVRVLGNGSLGTSSITASGYGIVARKLAATVLANLSVTSDIQRMVADYPNALTGLFTSLEVEDGERALSLQLQECAAMALGNLALVKENRRKIVDFGNTDGLARLAKVLFQDDNPGGQEYAAWALANLSHDRYDSEDIAVKIGENPNIVRGLARLLQLPTADHHEFGSRWSIGMQEQSVRALANLTHPRGNQVKIARIPNVVKALAAALLSRRYDQNLSPTIQEHAARALANLTSAEEVWKSSEFFGDTLRALVDVLSPDNVEASQKTRKYGALALGNFLLASSHHRAIINSKQAMGGLVKMLYSCDNFVSGKEQAAWALANLAQGRPSIKTAIVCFPFALTGLLGLLSDHESQVVRAQAMRALAGIGDDILNECVSMMSGTGSSRDARPSNRRLFSRFEIPSRAEACI